MLVWSFWTRLQISPNLWLVTRSVALKYCMVCYFGIKDWLLHHRDTPQVIYVLSYKFLLIDLNFWGHKGQFQRLYMNTDTHDFESEWSPLFSPQCMTDLARTHFKVESYLVNAVWGIVWTQSLMVQCIRADYPLSLYTTFQYVLVLPYQKLWLHYSPDISHLFRCQITSAKWPIKSDPPTLLWTRNLL